VGDLVTDKGEGEMIELQNEEADEIEQEEEEKEPEVQENIK
jgi:hypothetical protein